MSIEFTAISVPRDVYDRHSNGTKLEALWKLGHDTGDFFEDPQGALAGIKAHLELFKDHIENYPTLLADIEALVQKMELPTLSLSLGEDWEGLKLHFEKTSAKRPILEKAFHSSRPTPHKVQCTYGTVDFMEGEELKELTAAIKAAGVPQDDAFEAAYEDLLDFYQEAVENDDVVLRGLE